MSIPQQWFTIRVCLTNRLSTHFNIQNKRYSQENCKNKNSLDVGFLQDTEILHIMLAAVIQITEIEFEEGDNGVAQIKDVAPFAYGN